MSICLVGELSFEYQSIRVWSFIFPFGNVLLLFNCQFNTGYSGCQGVFLLSYQGLGFRRFLACLLFFRHRRAIIYLGFTFFQAREKPFYSIPSIWRYSLSLRFAALLDLNKIAIISHKSHLRPVLVIQSTHL